jgi:hypothetical protein
VVCVKTGGAGEDPRGKYTFHDVICSGKPNP